jgi:hypothetical protein
MSDLDDALDSSTPMLSPAIITAEWEELPPGYAAAAPAIDRLTDLTDQVGPGGYTVGHSFDDGLPNPVTMTSGNDAGGTLVADLIGRPANVADTWGWRATPATGNGTGTSVTVTPAGDTVFGDYTIVAVAVDGAATVTQNNMDPNDPNDWKLLRSQVDGTLQLHVFGRNHYTGAPVLSLTLSASLPWSWIAASTYAQTHSPALGLVPVLPGTAVGASESVSQTTHTLPAQTLDNRGYTVGIFVTTGALTWTPGGDGVEVSEIGASPRLEFTRSPFRTQPGDYVMTSVTSGATAVAAMIGLPMVVADRPFMDAMEYFSPFNRQSPIVDFERDTASMTAEQPVVTASGVVSTPLFKGRMAGVNLKGRLAETSAVSKTRIDLDKSLVLPPVHAVREGLTTDWVTNYLMAHGGQYAGVAPSPQTRQWVPFYGSLHPFLGGMFTYPRGYEYIGGVETNWRPLGDSVPGPFVTGMYAQQQTALTQALRIQFDDQPPLSGLPGMEGEYNDMMSLANNRGRMTVWLRGDPAVAAAASLGAYSDLLFEYRMEVRSSYNGGGTNLGGVMFQVLGTGQIRLRMGSQLVGYATLDLTPEFIPQDGEWHFLGIAWDWALEEIDVRMDNVVWNTSAWTTDVSTLPATEAAMRMSGGYIQSHVLTKIPISEFQVEVGPTMYTEGFARFWPSNAAPSQTAVYRPTYQKLEALAEDTPIQGYPTLAELARATLSHYRTNEEDNFEFLPLTYFGEPDQMTPTVVADTKVNAGELNVVRDPSKTRNVVTLEYNEVRVDAKISTVLSLTDSITIPRGVTYMTFPLDIPTVELQGALLPYGNDPNQYFNLWELWQSEIDAPATIPNWFNFMTVNTKADGSGTNWDKTTISARIVGYTASTVTIRFTNADAIVLYLANNGQDVPHMRILGYAVRTTPAYTTSRDEASVAKRGERALTAGMEWIQSRDVAVTTASQLVNILSRPRDEVVVQVMGDPRRKPGQLVTLADSDGTKAEGDWRVLSIVHKGNGPMYVQDLQLVRVLPIGVWDGVNGWDQASWAE